MASYRFHFLKRGQIMGNAIREFASDLDAEDKASKLAKRCQIETWLNDKWVACVNAYEEPLSTREQISS